MKNKNFKGFTLVELVIVIVILAILSTVSFVGFSSYTKSARDTNRLTSLKSIETGLKVYYSQSSKYPDPDNYVTIQASGTTIGYQGIIGDSVSKLIKSSSTPKDPYDFNNYVYYLNADKNKFELLGYMELSDKVNTSYLGVNKTYAIDLSQRSLKILGSPLGIILDSQKNVLTGSVFEIKTSTSNYISYFGDNDFIIGSGSQFYSNIYNRRSDLLNNKNIAKLDDTLVGYWDMESLTGGKLKDFSKFSNDGTLSGGITVGGSYDSVLGTSTYFDGVDDNITINQLFSGSYLGITYSLNVKLLSSTYPTDRVGLMSQNSFFRFYYSPSLKKISCASNTTNNGWNWCSNYSTTQIGYDNWNNLSIIFDGKGYKFFINGTYVGGGTELTGNLTNNFSTNPFWLGKLWDGSFLKGNIKSARVYNRALSDAEIKNLYNSTLSN